MGDTKIEAQPAGLLLLCSKLNRALTNFSGVCHWVFKLHQDLQEASGKFQRALCKWFKSFEKCPKSLLTESHGVRKDVVLNPTVCLDLLVHWITVQSWLAEGSVLLNFTRWHEDQPAGSMDTLTTLRRSGQGWASFANQKHSHQHSVLTAPKRDKQNQGYLTYPQIFLSCH